MIFEDKGISKSKLNFEFFSHVKRPKYLKFFSQKTRNGKKRTSSDSDSDEFETAKRGRQHSSDSEEMNDAEETRPSTSNVHGESEVNESDDDENVLDDEPVVDRGLASALRLAVSKGYLVKEKQNARFIKTKNAIEMESKNFTVEEKNHYDIDAKYERNNRDRFSGPLSDFTEKKGYKPDVKLDYIDERGHSMNEKEAFRYLSHRFHGKGSGKKKTEKRIRKDQESELMKKMSSGDTPLNTVSLLIEKQKSMQQAYVVLSAPKGGAKNDQ